MVTTAMTTMMMMKEQMGIEDHGDGAGDRKRTNGSRRKRDDLDRDEDGVLR